MTLILKPEYKELLKQVAEQEGFQSYAWDIKSSEAQGALSNMILVTLKSDKNELNLVLKVNEPKMEIFIDTLSIFKGEIYMYEKLLVMFEEFRKTNGVQDPSLGIARYYGQYGNTCLALENLTVQGYKLRYITEPLDEDHLILVMRHYGKLHSTSYAMKNKHPDLFKELVKGLRCSKDKNTRQDMAKTGYFTKQGIAFASLISRGDVESTKIVQKLQKVTSRFNNVNTFDQDNHVVVHGDCHCQNMLFKYDDKSNKPTEMKLVDWQISTLASPVHDLSYFFLLCSSKEDLFKYRYYLKVYHDELSKNLREMGCDPAKCFPYNQLELHWKECVLFGLSMCLIVYLLAYHKKQLKIVDVEDPRFFDQLDEFISEMPADLQKAKRRTIDLLLFIDSENWI